MFNQTVFCERLRDLRTKHGLSQARFGAVLGISKPAISDIERGRRTTTIDKLVEIADFFDVSLDYLVGRSDDPSMH